MSSCAEQCRALSAGGLRCTRRVNKASTNGLCGTHMRSTPHGTVHEPGSTAPPSDGWAKSEVRVQEVCGINYYVDDDGNVYDPRDVVGQCTAPRIVGKWVHMGNERYRIPELGVEDPPRIST